MKKLVTLLLGALVSFSAIADMQVPQHEKDALLDMYHATGGYEKWRDWQSDLEEPKDYGWHESDSLSDVCNWFNVECACSTTYTNKGCSGDGETNVARIDLPKGAAGKLPDSIGDLTELREVLISETDISGTLPPSVGNWTKLEKLVLQFGKFSGKIPDEVLNWENLHYVMIHANALYTDNEEVADFLTRHDKLNLTILESDGWYGNELVDFSATQANDKVILSTVDKFAGADENSIDVEFEVESLGGGWAIAFVSENIDGPFTEMMMGPVLGEWGDEREIWVVPGLKRDTNYFISIRSQYGQGWGPMSDGARSNTFRVFTDVDAATQPRMDFINDEVKSSGGGGGGMGPVLILLLALIGMLKYSTRKIPKAL